ncbi:putative FMN-dependent luciferase-like monooxygenase [Reyranella sp.]|jgi:putative FMN-dependent luciferase-like monooxygenase|uniref:putative FMN-dependent luciferase-like monooxygenase n=1 Tax=Reyranella sp. TaxID=1929291 RepID=UPI000BCF7499|nr:putative FMN-dependent luciferase-like monooxygenase [Reyranella sp.]OYY42317.1 MAG: putative FMN-dependent luciferase-like monooxygenase [Rhodospirillales bacterium 35-66-84]OYZ94003.1 MAG: putative FMN-dependent luciferase-like monooxygenase [Rhodospirillales bacterium 24-66-33]OZB22349.1 MAG: putative FMN-dependent luciferase-like monooxygenase [Rhodospirillales bacterium 39-66-50]HQS17533.1 putative FMN-dependent luciferase-like monooxygenase [Reyranella sp.]HQT14338.1 putative FMN-depe
MTTFPIKRLGFFTRLLDQVDAAERYRLATQQIVQAEKCGFDSAWIAQHHFHEGEGGLPAPFVFLAHAAAHTSRIRLGTGIVTLPLELPIRVAEDAAVTDLVSEGRLEVGVGPGGNLSAFTAFGLESDQRHALFDNNLALLKTAWSGGTLPGGDKLYPSSPSLVDRIWQATFTVSGARRAGLAGDGLMLSRTQPRSPEAPQASLADIQNPMLDAYLEALPKGVEPRILASRTIFVADDRNEAMRLAEAGLSRMRHRLAATGNFSSGSLVGDLIRAMDVHIGTPDEVIASLQADSTLQRSTDLTMQVHSIDPPHPYILRSIELFAGKVAPALGWAPEVKAGTRQVA